MKGRRRGVYWYRRWWWWYSSMATWLLDVSLPPGWLLAVDHTLPDIDRAQASGSDWRMVPPPPPLIDSSSRLVEILT
jgi:hypothetical protein